MNTALTTAGSGMVAQQYNLDVIANNLANVNTNGYKGQRAQFQDLMYQTWRASGASNGGRTAAPEALQIGLGAKFASSTLLNAQGALQSTGAPLDLAIQGDGFFKVTLADGSAAYTRDGSFKRDSAGLVVTSDGYKLDPEITIPVGATQVSVSASGDISAILPGNSVPVSLGTITLSSFPNPAGLTRLGQNLYQEGGASGPATPGNPGTNGLGQIASGYLEGSNVQVVEEMVHMISAQRAYEINSKAIQTADDMLNVANQLKR